MTRARIAALCALMIAGMALAGCGTGIRHAANSSAATHSTTSAAAHPDAAAVAVIRGWSRALRQGRVRAAARYFAFPSVFANGGVALVIRSRRQAIVANASLSCGARVLSVTHLGGVYHAVFRLTDRPGPGGDCGTGTGQEGATDFVIAHGRIVHWLRAPIHERTAPTPPADQEPTQEV